MKTGFINMGGFSPKYNKKEIRCPVCGEMFRPAAEHSYTIGRERSKLVCTYSCMRKWEKGYVKELKTQETKPRRYKAVRVVETGETFNGAKECANHLNAALSSVYKAILKGATCHGLHIEAVEEGDTK
jgi:hypothetical protein